MLSFSLHLSQVTWAGEGRLIPLAALGPPAGLVKGLQQALKKGLQQALKKGTVPHRCPLVEVAMESKVQS